MMHHPQKDLTYRIGSEVSDDLGFVMEKSGLCTRSLLTDRWLRGKMPVLPATEEAQGGTQQHQHQHGWLGDGRYQEPAGVAIAIRQVICQTAEVRVHRV